MDESVKGDYHSAVYGALMQIGPCDVGVRGVSGQVAEVRKMRFPDGTSVRIQKVKRLPRVHQGAVDVWVDPYVRIGRALSVIRGIPAQAHVPTGTLDEIISILEGGDGE